MKLSSRPHAKPAYKVGSDAPRCSFPPYNNFAETSTWTFTILCRFLQCFRSIVRQQSLHTEFESKFALAVWHVPSLECRFSATYVYLSEYDSYVFLVCKEFFQCKDITAPESSHFPIGPKSSIFTLPSLRIELSAIKKPPRQWTKLGYPAYPRGRNAAFNSKLCRTNHVKNTGMRFRLITQDLYPGGGR